MWKDALALAESRSTEDRWYRVIDSLVNARRTAVRPVLLSPPPPPLPSLLFLALLFFHRFLYHLPTHRQPPSLSLSLVLFIFYHYHIRFSSDSSSPLFYPLLNIVAHMRIHYSKPRIPSIVSTIIMRYSCDILSDFV